VLRAGHPRAKPETGDKEAAAADSVHRVAASPQCSRRNATLCREVESISVFPVIGGLLLALDSKCNVLCLDALVFQPKEACP
jgi:hypothetical protein